MSQGLGLGFLDEHFDDIVNMLQTSTSRKVSNPFGDSFVLPRYYVKKLKDYGVNVKEFDGSNIDWSRSNMREIIDKMDDSFVYNADGSVIPDQLERWLSLMNDVLLDSKRKLKNMILKKRYINYSPVPAAIAAAGAGAGSGAGAAGGLGAAKTAATWASVGASGLDVIGGQAFGIANLIMQAKQLQYQNAWNEKVYEEQKMMADPAYRMQRLRAAGLNPYGDYSTPMTSAATSAPDASGVGNALNGLAGSLSNSTAKVFQALSTKLAFKQLELEQKKLIMVSN